MASRAAVLHPRTKQQIAHKSAGVLPAELSPRAAVGILGVGLGAGICALTGRMLGLGLADLKGSLGISYDEGAWIGSAYNASQMFIVVFSVMGHELEIHPLPAIFTVMIGGAVGGIVGIYLSVPLVGTLRLIWYRFSLPKGRRQAKLHAE